MQLLPRTQNTVPGHHCVAELLVLDQADHFRRGVVFLIEDQVSNWPVLGKHPVHVRLGHPRVPSQGDKEDRNEQLLAFGLSGVPYHVVTLGKV